VKARLLLIPLAVAALGSGYSSPPQPREGPPPPPPDAGIDQRLGAKVPLDLPFRDEHGNRVPLGDCTAVKPTVLVLAYYRCPMLCTQVLNGLLRALRAIPDTAGGAFNVVVVSFDPREKPPLAALKKAAYLEEYGRPGADAGWHFLTGDPVAIASLTDAVGFRYKYDPDTEQYAHGSGIMVLAPDGTVSRYLLGVRFEPRDLRLALAEAGEGKVGSPADQVLLLCYRYDPATGTYTFRIIRALKWLSGLAVLGVAGLVGALAWRGRRGAARDASATARPAGGD
jgi:protein SCO1/2